MARGRGRFGTVASRLEDPLMSVDGELRLARRLDLPKRPSRP